MAAYSRTLVEEANHIQDKYTFVFDTKPGAGNAIAANFVKNNSNTILATSSAFFIRPNFYPNESYNVNDFQELMPQCNAPIAISSTKYQTWADVPKDKPLNIGTSGLGVTTHLTSLQIVSKFPNVQVVPFKSTNDSILSMMSGNIDLHVGFLGESESWGDKVHILGTTGPKSVNHHPILAGEGFAKIVSNMDAPHHLVVPKSVPDEKFREWRKILVQAARAESVQKSYLIDHCYSMSEMKDQDLHAWYESQQAQWKKLSTGVKID